MSGDPGLYERIRHEAFGSVDVGGSRLLCDRSGLPHGEELVPAAKLSGWSRWAKSVCRSAGIRPGPSAVLPRFRKSVIRISVLEITEPSIRISFNSRCELSRGTAPGEGLMLLSTEEVP